MFQPHILAFDDQQVALAALYKENGVKPELSDKALEICNKAYHALSPAYKVLLQSSKRGYMAVNILNAAYLNLHGLNGAYADYLTFVRGYNPNGWIIQDTVNFPVFIYDGIINNSIIFTVRRIRDLSIRFPDIS